MIFYNIMMGKDDSPSPAICMLQDTSKISLEDDFLKVTPITTIEALKDMKMVIYYLKHISLTYFLCQT
jgi:hypothetical protein